MSTLPVPSSSSCSRPPSMSMWTMLHCEAVVATVSWAWLQSGIVMMVLVRFPWGVMILSVTTLL